MVAQPLLVVLGRLQVEEGALRAREPGVARALAVVAVAAKRTVPVGGARPAALGGFTRRPLCTGERQCTCHEEEG